MNRTLPSYEVIRKMYLVDGLTYRAIARHFGADPSVIFNKAKKTALRRGDPWPFIRTAPRRRTRPGAHTLHDVVDAQLVVMEIKDFCRASGMSYKAFADAVGVHPSYLWNLTAPSRPRKYIGRQKAHLFMNYIQKHEQEAA